MSATKHVTHSHQLDIGDEIYLKKKKNGTNDALFVVVSPFVSFICHQHASNLAKI